MTVISTQEFVDNQNKYFNMAINQDVCIKRDEGMFQIRYNPVEENYVKKPKYKQPDADFYRAISGEEFKKRALEIVEKVHNQFYNK